MTFKLAHWFAHSIIFRVSPWLPKSEFPTVNDSSTRVGWCNHLSFTFYLHIVIHLLSPHCHSPIIYTLSFTYYLHIVIHLFSPHCHSTMSNSLAICLHYIEIQQKSHFQKLQGLTWPLADRSNDIQNDGGSNYRFPCCIDIGRLNTMMTITHVVLQFQMSHVSNQLLLFAWIRNDIGWHQLKYSINIVITLKKLSSCDLEATCICKCQWMPARRLSLIH